MKKYNVEYNTMGYGPYFYEYDRIVLSEHSFLIMAFWTAYKLLFRHSKIKIVNINKYKYIDGLQVSENFFKLEKL